jgi:hypothetical protein
MRLPRTLPGCLRIAFCMTHHRTRRSPATIAVQFSGPEADIIRSPVPRSHPISGESRDGIVPNWQNSSFARLTLAEGEWL